VKYRPKVLQLQQRERIIQIQDRRQDMPKLNPLAHTSSTEFPRPPTPDEFESIRQLVCDKSYPAGDSCSTERAYLYEMLSEATSSGRFIVSYASSDTPGYFGRIIFLIWPDTSITIYHHACMDLPRFDIDKHDWYQCDVEGMPWI
jgi:hypothetical protein